MKFSNIFAIKNGSVTFLDNVILRKVREEGSIKYYFLERCFYTQKNDLIAFQEDFIRQVSFDHREMDKRISDFADENFKFKRCEKINKKRIAILATEFYDSGGHTECVKSLVNNLCDNYKIDVYLTKKSCAFEYAPKKIKAMKKNANFFGVNCNETNFKSTVKKLFNKITVTAPRVIFVYMHPDDAYSAMLMHLLKKYTNIKLIFFNHSAHNPTLGMNIADITTVALPSTHYVDAVYRKCDNHTLINAFCDRIEDVVYYSDEEISKKRKEIGINNGELFTMTGSAWYKLFNKDESAYFSMIKRILIREPKLKHVVITNLPNQKKQIVEKMFEDAPEARKRLIFLPLVSKYEILFQSCDVFIDSFPIASAFTQLDLMKFKKPTVVKINRENILWSFDEYLPKNYPYMFETVAQLEEGVIKLIHDKDEQKRIVDMNFEHYMKNFEGNAVKKKYIELIENSDDLSVFRANIEENERYVVKDKKAPEKINERLLHAKIVHIMHGEKFDKPFVNMINRHFNIKDHLFLCSNDFVYNPQDWIPDSENTLIVNDLSNIRLDYPNIEKIICHSLIRPDLVDKLYNEPELLKKSYWEIWGLDLYDGKHDLKNSFVRRNFKGYINKSDEEYARKKYGMKGKFFDAFYNFPISKEMLDSVKEENHDYVRIQINNSCDMSTFPMLKVLSKFKKENIRLMNILSYEQYGNMSYKDKIIKKGTKFFGEKFEYIERWLSPKDYVNLLAQNDILIFNQDRQQGVGNILASIYLGKKIYIKKNVSVNKYFNERGVKIFNTEDIKWSSFKQFKKFEEREQNIKNVAKYLDENFLASLWNTVFEDN